MRNNLPILIERLGMENECSFQQGNHAKHTVMDVKHWLLYNIPRQLFTLYQSSDHNATEHIWAELSNSIEKYVTAEIYLKIRLQGMK